MGQQTGDGLRGGGSSVTPQLGGADGWFVIRDGQYTQASPLPVQAGQEIQLTNDGLLGVDDAYAPDGLMVNDFYDAQTGRLLAPSIGKDFFCRVNFMYLPDTIDAEVKGYIDIGGAQNKITSDTASHSLGAGVADEMSLLMSYYQRETFQANGGQVLIRPTRKGVLWGISYTIFD